jgi:hypothetical protein
MCKVVFLKPLGADNYLLAGYHWNTTKKIDLMKWKMTYDEKHFENNLMPKLIKDYQRTGEKKTFQDGQDHEI